MSRVNDIKKMKRKQQTMTPAQALAEIVGEEEKNVGRNEEAKKRRKEENNERRKEEKNVERKRVSFDLRTDLHKELKLQALMQEKNIYMLIEEALEKYLKASK